MSTPDPYVVPLPQRITTSGGGPTDEFRNWLEYDNRWKHDIWQYSGGGSDLFADLQNQINSLDTRVSQNEIDIAQNQADISDLQAFDAALPANIYARVSHRI